MSLLFKKANTICLKYIPELNNVCIEKLETLMIDNNNRLALEQALSCVKRAMNQNHHYHGVNSHRTKNVNQAFRVPASLPPARLQTLADRILNPAAHTKALNPVENDISSIVNAYTKIQHDYDIVMTIVDRLIKKQQAFLVSGNWLDLKKLSYHDVAKEVSKYSESTVSRRIKSLNLKLGKRIFSAKELICTNNLPFVCKQVSLVASRHPDVGRPTLIRHLHKKGFDFSDGQVKNAMRLLHRVKIRSILNEIESCSE